MNLVVLCDLALPGRWRLETRPSAVASYIAVCWRAAQSASRV